MPSPPSPGDPWSVIADRDASATRLVDAIRGLGPVTEPARSWSAIANDDGYSPEHRRRAVFELFRRHASPGMTLGDLGRLLDGATWLHDDDVSVVTALGGKIPVEWTLADTVFVLAVFPDLPGDRFTHWAVYVRAAGKVERGEFLQALRMEAIGPTEVLEIGLAPSDPGEQGG